MLFYICYANKTNSSPKTNRIARTPIHRIWNGRKSIVFNQRNCRYNRISASNSSKLTNLVDRDEKVRNIITTPGGNQEVWLLTEDGLYEVLFQSRKPIAKQFKKGVKQILHEVRTTGGYISTTPNDTPEEIMARALTIAQATLAKREERLKQLEAETEQQQATIELQDKEIKEAAPKVNYYNNHLQSVNTLTSTQIAKQIGMDAEKLHKKLKEAGIIYRQSGQWLLHSPLLYLGITLHPYPDIYSFRRFDRNQCIYGMD